MLPDLIRGKCCWIRDSRIRDSKLMTIFALINRANWIKASYLLLFFKTIWCNFGCRKINKLLVIKKAGKKEFLPSKTCKMKKIANDFSPILSIKIWYDKLNFWVCHKIENWRTKMSICSSNAKKRYRLV